MNRFRKTNQAGLLAPTANRVAPCEWVSTTPASAWTIEYLWKLPLAWYTRSKRARAAVVVVKVRLLQFPLFESGRYAPGGALRLESEDRLCLGGRHLYLPRG